MVLYRWAWICTNRGQDVLWDQSGGSGALLSQRVHVTKVHLVDRQVILYHEFHLCILRPVYGVRQGQNKSTWNLEEKTLIINKYLIPDARSRKYWVYQLCCVWGFRSKKLCVRSLYIAAERRLWRTYCLVRTDVLFRSFLIFLDEIFMVSRWDFNGNFDAGKCWLILRFVMFLMRHDRKEFHYCWFCRR